MHRSPILLVLLALGSCCSDPVDQSTYFCLGEMPLAEEQALGDAYAPNIDAMYDGVYADAAAAEYLGQLIVEMAGHSVRAEDFTWKFSILNTSMPNAFAVPGGYIYITRGLLAAMETEGQFISVMGHELGHVEHRHSHKGLGGKMLGGILVGIIGTAESTLTQSEEPGLATSLSAGATSLFLLRYDRSQELQSDKRGVYYAAEMGYDPAEAIKTFEYFQSIEDEAGASQMEWFRTHPLNENRITDIEAEIQRAYPSLIGQPKESFRPYKDNNKRFDKVLARFKQAQPVYDRYDKAWKDLAEGIEKEDKDKIRAALPVFEECAADLPDEPLFHTAVGMSHFAMERLGPARTAFQRAISLDDAYLPARKLFRPHLLLGLAWYEDKSFDKARDELLVAADAFPMNPQPYYFLGRSYEELDRNEDAIAAYRKVIELEGNPKGSLTAQSKERLTALGAS